MVPESDGTTIDVVFAADANYAMPLAVAMCSVALHSRRHRLAFHVIQSGIVGPVRDKVEASLAGAGHPAAFITWIDAPLERLAGLELAHEYTSPLTFARLLIEDLLPTSVRKVLYLDCDVVANEDIGELWRTDFKGKSLLAVRDSSTTGASGGVAAFEELGIPADQPGFNAGVLLIALDRWRDNDTSRKAFDYLRKHADRVRMADQEALNAVLWDDWKQLDYRWNWQIVWRNYRLGRAKPTFVVPTDRKSIVHFITAEKPWLPGCDYEERAYFFRYLDRTAWSGFKVPLLTELKGRLRRGIQDARNFLGVLRRRVLPRSLVRRGFLSLPARNNRS